MYNLVSCYDSLEMKARGDVLSDKVYLGDQEGEGEGLRISQSESILTDMTHVISPMSFNGKSPMLQQYQAISSPSSAGAGKCNGTNGVKHAGGKAGRHVSYSAAKPEEFRIPITVSNRYRDWPEVAEVAPSKEADREPYCFPVFRWSLILVGLGMLVCVLVVLVQLLVDWGRGTA